VSVDNCGNMNVPGTLTINAKAPASGTQAQINLDNNNGQVFTLRNGWNAAGGIGNGVLQLNANPGGPVFSCDGLRNFIFSYNVTFNGGVNGIIPSATSYLYDTSWNMPRSSMPVFHEFPDFIPTRTGMYSITYKLTGTASLISPLAGSRSDYFALVFTTTANVNVEESECTIYPPIGTTSIFINTVTCVAPLTAGTTYKVYGLINNNGTLSIGTDPSNYWKLIIRVIALC